jgi:hypothetical protein
LVILCDETDFACALHAELGLVSSGAVSK